MVQKHFSCQITSKDKVILLYFKLAKEKFKINFLNIKEIAIFVKFL